VTTDDHLLCALDQLINTVYWCRQRGMPITAGSAILEAVGDWLDSHDPTRDDGVPSVSAEDADGADPIGMAFDRLGRHIRAREPDQVPLSVTLAFADALNHWSAAAAAEHHQSTPFGTATDQTHYTVESTAFGTARGGCAAHTAT
jgi:hypothetical protein